MPLLPGCPDVHFGYGTINEIGPELSARGIKRPLIITDQGLVDHGVYRLLREAIPSGQDFAVFDAIPENPTIAGVEKAAEVYREKGCDGIIGLGGGSVLDSGKALRVIATHPGPLIEYLSDTSKITRNVAPYITIPTTAGTGAEVTFGGGIHPAPNTVALGIRSPHVKPDLAICDPELTLTLPPRLTAATGMDALGHCIEGYVSINENPPGKAVALDGIGRVAAYIERAVKDGNDREARHHMLMAALEGGIAIYMGLGPIHTLSHIFGDSPLHHGTLVTVAAPAVLRFYEGTVDAKLSRMAEAMGASPGVGIATAIEELNARIGLPSSVREMGYLNNDIESLADEAVASFFNPPAPKKPTREEYRQIILEVLG